MLTFLRCFWINLPLGVPPIIIMTLFFTDPQESSAKNMTWAAILKQLDLLGTVAFVPAIACLFLALSWAGTKYAFDSPIVLCLYAACILLMTVFIWDQWRKQDAATLPPRIFKQRSIIAGVSVVLQTPLINAYGVFSSFSVSAATPVPTQSSTTCPRTSRLYAGTLQPKAGT